MEVVASLPPPSPPLPAASCQMPGLLPEAPSRYVCRHPNDTRSYLNFDGQNAANIFCQRYCHLSVVHAWLPCMPGRS